MLSQEYETYMRSPEWAGLKRSLWKLRGRRCMICRSTHRVQAHHLVYRSPIQRGTVRDLMPACFGCHSFIHEHPWLFTDLVAADSLDEKRTIIISVVRRELGIAKPATPLTIQELTAIRRRFPSRSDPGYLKIRRENRQAKREWEAELRGSPDRADTPARVKKLDKLVKSPQPSKT